MKYRMTTQAQIRKAFWEAYPNADRKKIKDDSGKGRCYSVDTQTLFVEYVNAIRWAELISEDLAFRVEL